MEGFQLLLKVQYRSSHENPAYGLQNQQVLQLDEPYLFSVLSATYRIQTDMSSSELMLQVHSLHLTTNENDYL